MAGITSECVEAQMLIRKPVSEVFEAFINPAITKHFWFTKGSGRLETGKTVVWEWEMYNVSTIVNVKDILPNKKIIIDWDEPPTSVEFEFTTLSDDSTYVTIKNYGFNKTGD
ncbi:MAG TPA: SRPBCC domain-containing protein, partial [Chitinophagaceae bacterium]|nr:SRPBCC domain-containing protein [Chitinophagaceae bacterium]